MAKIRWEHAPGVVTKSSLKDGVLAWCRERAGHPRAQFAYLDQLTLGDLTLLAEAMGYRAPARRAAERAGTPARARQVAGAARATRTKRTTRAAGPEAEATP